MQVMNKKQSVYIYTFGCQMNIRDSEVIYGLLRTMNYELTTNPDKADVVIFNTCSVRQHAEDKVWSELGKFKKVGSSSGRAPRSLPIIGVVGCMAQNYKEKIFDRVPNVDFVVGPQDLHKIPGIINKLSCEDFFQRKFWETNGSVRPEEIYHSGFYLDKKYAYVVISEGCSNYCSYCVVPYVRGELRNRNYKEILREIEEAVDKGITKITLLGQNVCAYGAEYREQSTENRENNVSFIKLLELVNQISGLEEFSFITSHPKDTTFDLFRAMANLKKLKKYLHLPVQSGSDRILKLMNRGYTRKFYLDLIDDYRKIVKDATLTTDIIVGFPTETETDFLKTFDLVKDIEFDAAYIFKYSPRPHTEAERLLDDVDKKEKERRHALILELQKEISRRRQ